ncbi:hypothetical protein Y1Q_0007885 [Alligator mississippiensis]|uniref:Uncharacterized protein n=1 Tax=Alligator mississippiensis TaxID=8496 RepID=A0A151NFH2_ALLMI|nr:hypothetical protein Y1Q_0007885 [Alligator mississippiensis]
MEEDLEDVRGDKLDALTGIEILLCNGRSGMCHNNFTVQEMEQPQKRDTKRQAVASASFPTLLKDALTYNLEGAHMGESRSCLLCPQLKKLQAKKWAQFLRGY